MGNVTTTNNAARPVNPYRAYIRWQRVAYPKQLWDLVASAIVFLIICNIIHLWRMRSRKQALMRARGTQQMVAGDSEANADKTNSTPVRSKGKRLRGAVDAAFRIFAFRRSIPLDRHYSFSLTEVFFTVGYLAAVLIWSFVHSHGGQRQFWGERTGAIASRQAPLLTLLAGKNNLVTLVTGISYEKVNIMHRAVGRTLFLAALFHSFEKYDMPKRVLAFPQIYTGVIATVAWTVIILTSFRTIRNQAFEFFLVVHILSVVAYLVSMYFHWKKDAMYLYLFIGFWMLDRVVRGIRLLFINRGKPQPRRAIVEHVSEDCIRLVLPNRHMTWKAGQHVFLTLPGVSILPFESHPMTIANIPERDEQGARKPTDLVFYIRAMDGFTRRLQQYGSRHHGELVIALADGPYGKPPPVNTFTTVILVAGGSGIASTLPLLLDIVETSRRKKSPVLRVLFVWSVKRRGDLNWAIEKIEATHKEAIGLIDIELCIHVSRPDDNLPSLAKLEELEDPVSPTSPDKKRSSEVVLEKPSSDNSPSTPTESQLKVTIGRPDIPRLLSDEIQSSKGPVAVVGCGPSHMTQAIRTSLCSGPAGPSAILKGGAEVSMFIESFGAVRPGEKSRK
ncbi:hypothetical protein FRC19_010185 [Serendipita sp. 401]|nr:hypothetical protein FRC19_010185 [Serendipita sp. 401]